LNPNLSAQDSVSYEAGIKGEAGAAYEINAYLIESEGEIVPFELAAFPGRSFFRNAGQSRRVGLEAQAQWQPVAGWTLALAYAYSDFQFTRLQQGTMRLDGNQIPGIPRHHLQGSAAFRHPAGWFGMLTMEYVGEFFADNVNLAVNPAHGRSRLQAGWEHTWGSVTATVFCGIQNLLDQEYNANVRLNAAGGRYFEPAPPINAFGGLALAFRPFK